MDFTYNMFIEAFLINAAISIDAFAVAFAYGSAGVRIPFKSLQIIK
ncbi:MAG: hypothetical protein FWD34_06230 [Oscillospiraceae bacterium]|nr:hypothetical protein [Oscillospiraceae bacterium]